MNENELSKLVIGESIKVHSQLGPGLLESVYEECVTFRLIKAGLRIEKQKPIPVIFEDVKLECGFRCDLLVENKLIIEVKAVETLNDIHLAQVLTYLKLTGVKLGLLMNFNVVLLKDGIRRVVNHFNRKERKVKPEYRKENSMADEKKLIKVTIDNINIEVQAGTSILQAARSIGGDVVPPAMCYYSKLQGSGGKCRTCLVEVTAGSSADPRPMPKLVASCRTNVMDGMVVKSITSARVIDARNGVVEFLLINHPLDCPICDQAGECHLQDLSYEHGKEGTRYEFPRRTFERHDLGPYIQLHMTRCILCYRCVFVADQLCDQRVHGVLDRGDHSEIATFIEKALDHDFIGNVIDVCPVGALTDRTFRFKNRVWFLKPMDAHRDCPKCRGKVTLWNRGDEVYRVTARKNQWGEVEDWICNDCRFDKKRTSDWIIDGPTVVSRHSVISAGHYIGTKQPKEFLPEVMGGRNPRLLMDIHSVSEVNRPEIHLSEIKGPSTSDVFDDNG